MVIRSRIWQINSDCLHIKIGNTVKDTIFLREVPVDSFYESLLKSFIMYGAPADLAMFNQSYEKGITRNSTTLCRKRKFTVYNEKIVKILN